MRNEPEVPAGFAGRGKTHALGLNRLRQKAKFRAKSARKIPQGLKPVLILRHLWHD